MINNISFFLLRISIIIIIVLIFITLFQRKLLYFPTKCNSNDLKNYIISPYIIEHEFITSDNIKLYSWFANAGENTPVLLWCHGNAGNIINRYEKTIAFAKNGISVFVFDYRGYGKNSGVPTEEGLYKDSEAAYNYLLNTLKIHKKNIIIYGKSLGGGVAVELAKNKEAKALILESTFTSIKEMTKKLYKYLVHFVYIFDKFDNIRKISSIKMPVLFIHGKKDKLIPWKMCEELYNKCKTEKDILYIKNAGHNSVYYNGKEIYFNKIKEFIGKIK